MVDFPQNVPRAPHAGYDEPRASILSNILAIVGFIILIVVMIWGLVNLTGIASPWFSSLFVKSEKAIEVTAPESARSGMPFSIFWNYKESTPGTYALLYQCQGGLQIQTESSAGGLRGIPCGAAFTIANADNQISLIPFLNGNSSIEMPVSIIFTSNSTSTSSRQAPEAQGNATIKIIPAAPSENRKQQSSTMTPRSAPVPAPKRAQPQAPKTPADLSVRIISATADMDGNGTAVFDITNVGGTSSGAYYFTANLPTQSGYTYVSPMQSSLAPGTHIASTLRFSDTISGIFSVSIKTPDSNPNNNYRSQSINAPYYYSNLYDYQAQNSTVSYPYTYTSGYNTMQPYQTYPDHQYTREVPD